MQGARASSAQAAPRAGERIDWRTVLMLCPSRRFTPAELALAIPRPLNRSVLVSVIVNLALPTLALALAFGRDNPWYVTAFLLGFVGALAVLGLMAWADPGSRASRHAYWALPVLAGLVAAWLLRDGEVTKSAVVAMTMLMVIGSLGLWFTIVHRHQYVSMRLAELAERERAVEMARRLAAAQLEPHFLFNTLASLQHWIETGDARAAPLLASLTAYLRATLPMFARATQPLAQEVLAVRRYLEVMAARLGSRLAWSIEIAPEVEALSLPPGLLLTLVENAVQHGIEPRIGGGRVRLRAFTEGAQAVIEVVDDGAGLASGSAEGIGLTNSRERLALTLGPAARLSLTAAHPQGCRAELRVPHAAGPRVAA
jgi:signal transduction histidine kinase